MMCPVKVLLVEDNPADTRLIMDHLRKSEVNIVINHVKDGAEALDCLHQRRCYEDVSLPDVVILDMNLPKVDGMTVLKAIKEDEVFNRIVVIVFGTSDNAKEVKKAYMKRANCYIVKPLDYDHLNDVLSSIEDFWFKYTTLPECID
ncbi:MAG: response regulator [Methanobacterium sp.]